MGSPCLNPRVLWKKPAGDPLIRTQKEACPYQMIYNITMIVMLLAISSKGCLSG